LIAPTLQKYIGANGFPALATPASAGEAISEKIVRKKIGAEIAPI
jgi:hypothetical protein